MAGYSWQHFYNSTTNSYPYSAAYAEKTGEEFYKKEMTMRAKAIWFLSSDVSTILC